MNKYCDHLKGISFDYYSSDIQLRRYPHTFDWRWLPWTLIEIPHGGSWKIEIKGEKSITVKSGETLVVPEGAAHKLTMTSRKEMKSEWLLASFKNHGVNDIIADTGVPRVLPADPENTLLIEKMRALGPSASEGSIIAAAKIQESGFRLLTKLLEQAKVKQISPASPGITRFLPVLRYIRENISRSITRTELADIIFLSPTRFHYVFKEALGMSPLDFVLNERIKLAGQLLISTDLSVGEVSVRCGFSTPYYFSRAFRKQTGLTPTGYRSRIINEYREKALKLV